MAFERLHILSVVLAVWFISTFIIMYAYATIAKDVDPVFPYISDTGTWVPESCLFGQLLSIGSFLLFFLIYVRYKYVEAVQPVRYKKENKICLYLGWLSALGINLVANFQETNVFSVHVLGAMMAFGLGAAYQLIMWKICHDLCDEGTTTTKKMSHFRMGLAITSMVTNVMCFTSALASILQFHGKDVTKWKKDDGGYNFHLFSSITEWICAFSTMLYMTTFYNDLKHLKMYEPEFEITK